MRPGELSAARLGETLRGAAQRGSKTPKQDGQEIQFGRISLTGGTTESDFDFADDTFGNEQINDALSKMNK